MGLLGHKGQREIKAIQDRRALRVFKGYRDRKVTKVFKDRKDQTGEHNTPISLMLIMQLVVALVRQTKLRLISGCTWTLPQPTALM